MTGDPVCAMGESGCIPDGRRGKKAVWRFKEKERTTDGSRGQILGRGALEQMGADDSSGPAGGKGAGGSMDPAGTGSISGRNEVEGCRTGGVAGGAGAGRGMRTEKDGGTHAVRGVETGRGLYAGGETPQGLSSPACQYGGPAPSVQTDRIFGGRDYGRFRSGVSGWRKPFGGPHLRGDYGEALCKVPV